MMEELKPCPFCGETPTVREGTERDGWIGHTAIVCMTQSNPFCISKWVELKKKKAIKAWNRRVE